ncbi:MAG: roadblock/LC7 domain-containing protein [Nitrospinae bacterium]|nr:roadblock/LC7 domain-containing protein [Nitrospinota bacterium]
MKDEQLREKRLVYYQEDVEQIEKLLQEFLKLSNAKAIFLIDKEGHLVSQEGATETMHTETLSALVAGSFAATKEMARMLGESEFSVMFHQGKRDHIHISLVSDRAISAIVFDEQTTVGMVNLYAKELIVKLEKIFSVASKRINQEHKMEEGYSESVQDRLDDMFKE